jgi:hypothetical protein
MDDSDSAVEAAGNTQVALEGDTLYIQTPNTSGWQWRRTPKLAVTVRHRFRRPADRRRRR